MGTNLYRVSTDTLGLKGILALAADKLPSAKHSKGEWLKAESVKAMQFENEGRTIGVAEEALDRSAGGNLPKVRAAAGAQAVLRASAADARQPWWRNRGGGVGVP